MSTTPKTRTFILAILLLSLISSHSLLSPSLSPLHPHRPTFSRTSRLTSTEERTDPTQPAGEDAEVAGGTKRKTHTAATKALIAKANAGKVPWNKVRVEKRTDPGTFLLTVGGAVFAAEC